MTFTRRNIPIRCCLVLLAACGGGGGGSSGNAAASKTFNYGAAQPPTAQEQAAAVSTQSVVSDTAAFGSAPDGAKAVVIVGMASDLAASALGGALIPGRSLPGTGLRQARSTATVADCATKSGNTITFTNCTETESGITVTVNGSVTAKNGTVSWDVTAVVSGTDSGVTVNATLHESGSLTVTATKVTGNAVLDLSGSVSNGQKTVNFGVAVAAVVDLTYQSNPACITAGTLEVKRVWTQVPEGASGSEFANAGVKLTWSSCNTFVVARSQ
ncbi:MAG: hypothetical protein E6J86_02415 [Deltaproteobacteria bacterium]|nr:MAG: hypothetical protein E6J86_02415 [Deltaproteobacteria bacterium]